MAATSNIGPPEERITYENLDAFRKSFIPFHQIIHFIQDSDSVEYGNVRWAFTEGANQTLRRYNDRLACYRCLNGRCRWPPHSNND